MARRAGLGLGWVRSITTRGARLGDTEGVPVAVYRLWGADEKRGEGGVSMRRQSQRGWPRAIRPYDSALVAISE